MLIKYVHSLAHFHRLILNTFDTIAYLNHPNTGVPDMHAGSVGTRVCSRLILNRPTRLIILNRTTECCHNFCAHCLEEYILSIRAIPVACPMCRREVKQVPARNPVLRSAAAVLRNEVSPPPFPNWGAYLSPRKVR